MAKTFSAGVWYKIKVGKHAGQAGEFIGDVNINDNGDVMIGLDFIGPADRQVILKGFGPVNGEMEFIRSEDLEFLADWTS